MITLTLRVKSDQFTAPAVRLFGTLAEHEATLESVNGIGDWKTVKLTLVIRRADILFVSLGSKRDAMAEGNSFVLYQSMSYNVNDSFEYKKSFERIQFDAAETHGLNRQTLRPHTDYLSKFDKDGGWALNNTWTAHGNVERRNAGVSTGIKFSEAGSTRLVQADTLKMEGDGVIAVRYLGKFRKGDTVTFSVRIKSSAYDTRPVAAEAGFLGIDKNGFRSQSIESTGNDNWNTITSTAVLQKDDELFIALNSCWPYLADEANSAIYFTDIKVSSVQRGVVLSDSLQEVGLSVISCLRHIHPSRRNYATQTEIPIGGASADSSGTA